jgi:putative methyltransferase (TIGR04325 family)
VENRTMVRLCIKKLKYKNLFFSNSLSKIKKIDIFFSSCAINYTKNPIETIKSIIKLKAKYLYFTRTPLTENQSLEYKQVSLLSENGPCKINNEKEMLIEYENKIISQQKFEDMFKNKFFIIEKYIDEKKTFFYKKKFVDTYTYILKKK